MRKVKGILNLTYVMAPPRKRQKVAGSQNQKTLGQVMATIKDVCAVRIALRDWIQEMHDLRHGLQSDQARAWPVERGGSFQEIVQRCWGDMDRLKEDSLSVLKIMSMVDDAADVTHLEQKWLALQD